MQIFTEKEFNKRIVVCGMIKRWWGWEGETLSRNRNIVKVKRILGIYFVTKVSYEF
jgi:hypothetical protein